MRTFRLTKIPHLRNPIIKTVDTNYSRYSKTNTPVKTLKIYAFRHNIKTRNAIMTFEKTICSLNF